MTFLRDLDLDAVDVAWAMVAALATVLAARYSRRGVLRLAHRINTVPDDLAQRASQLVLYFVVAIGCGVVLAALGADIQPLLIALIVVLAAAFLMLRGIADNLGAALVIQTRRPVGLGDLVESDDHVGHVVDLNSRSVVLMPPHGRTVHLPNSLFMSQPLVNHSAAGALRSQVEVVVGRQPSTTAGPCLALAVAAAKPVVGALDAPSVRAVVTSVGADVLVFRLDVWHTPDDADVVRSRVAVAVEAALVDEGHEVATRWPPLSSLGPWLLEGPVRPPE